MEFQRGQILVAEVLEVQRDGSLVCEVNQRLHRFSNHTALTYKVGQKIKLQVTHVNPLQLSLFETRKNFERLI
ncbi:MAG: hypothetical protein ACLGGX_07275 [Bdellovibrionia bacterium]